MSDPKTTVCPECGGRGMVSYMTIGLTRCGQCGGSGAVATAPEQIATTVPALDWSKAVQFENGSMIEVLDRGAECILIRRVGVEGQTAFWEIRGRRLTDGRAEPGSLADRAGLHVINRKDVTDV